MVKIDKKKLAKAKAAEEKKVIEEAAEEENILKATISKVEKKLEEVSDRILLGKANGREVFQKSSFIKYETVRGPVNSDLLPDHLRKYLRNMGFGTNVYIKDKEWLIKHGADLDKIEELKKRVSDHCNA